MGTLYVVGAPAGDPRDLTRRALRTLRESALVVAEGEDDARQLLDRHGLDTPLAPAAADRSLDALAKGDVSLLYPGQFPAPLGPGYQLIRLALDRGHPVVPIPGASLPITALVISGLPADSFVYLGELPRDPTGRRELLLTVRSERCSILALTRRDLLPVALVDLHSTLGDRPLALASPSALGVELVWSGRSAEASEGPFEPALPGPYVLVIGGASHEAVRWDEERLCAEIRKRQAAGLGAKAISQELAESSGWSSREIYRLCVELARSDRIHEGEIDVR